MEIALSILIPTTSARKEIIKPLLAELERQMSKKPGQVELIINEHETDCVGKKRNDLLLAAKGDYVVFIDSDDKIAPTYILVILCAIECEAPDCIGINGHMTTNGKNPVKWYISKEYKTWHTKDGVYLRTPNHISPVKREIALKAMFPEISFGEDHAYSMRILPFLQTESIISAPLYHYDYRTDK